MRGKNGSGAYKLGEGVLMREHLAYSLLITSTKNLYCMPSRDRLFFAHFASRHIPALCNSIGDRRIFHDSNLRRAAHLS